MTEELIVPKYLRTCCHEHKAASSLSFFLFHQPKTPPTVDKILNNSLVKWPLLPFMKLFHVQMS